jgi:hypothetical protein
VAAFTSKASGNWSSSGQTTWNEVGVPGNGDTVTISYPHEVTINGAVIVGGSGVSGTVAITITDSGIGQRGTLKIVTGGSLLSRGDVFVNGGMFWIDGTGEFDLDSSVSASPSTTEYYLRGESPNIGTGRTAVLKMTGTDENNRARIGSILTGGALPGYIFANGFGGFSVDLSFAEIDNMSTIDADANFANWRAVDTVFGANCPDIRPSTYFLADDFLIERTQFLGGTWQWDGTYENGTPTGTRLLQDVTFWADVNWYDKELIANRVSFMSGITVNTDAKCEGWNGVFVRRTAGGGGGGVVLPACSTYGPTFFLYDNAAASNPHYVSFSQDNRPATITVEDWVIQPNVGDSQGDQIFVEGATTFALRRMLALPNLPDGECGGCFVNAGAVNAVSVEHCTFALGSGQDGIACAEIGDTAVGTFTSIKGNIGYRMTAGPGALFTRSNAYSGRTDIATPSGVGNNLTCNVTGAHAGYSNTTYPRYIGIQAAAVFSVAPNASTTDVTNITGLPFVDSTRNIATYAVARGLALASDSNATKIAAVVNAIAAIPNPADPNYDPNVSILELISWIRDGWTPDATVYPQIKAAHDTEVGSWIGALEGYKGVIRDHVYSDTTNTDTLAGVEVPAKPNGCVFVLIRSSSDPTGVSRNGQSFTKIMSYGYTATLWQLEGPDVGTFDVTVAGAGSVYHKAVWVLHNVSQSDPTRGTVQQTQTGSAASKSDTLTAAQYDLVLDAGYAGNSSPVTHPGADQDKIIDETAGSYNNWSSQQVPQNGTEVMSWTRTAGNPSPEWMQVAWVVRTALVLQTLVPNGIVSSSGWTASDTTLDGDTSDADDATFMSATAEGAVATLTLGDPSPAFDSIDRIAVRIRHRLA